MMMEFLANAIVGISAAFSGMWVLFQILERRSHFLWRLLGVQLCRVLLDYCKYRFSI